jgi:hypothetical protein
MNSSDENTADILPKIYEDISSGLLYTHSRIDNNTSKTLESTSFLYAPIELLAEKQLIKIEELDERKRQVAERSGIARLD